MSKKFNLLLFSMLLCICLAACGTDPQVTQFKNDIDTFCTDISTIDSAINSIDANADNARNTLLDYLNQLDKRFQDFAALDFPKDYDYLESMADEASTYMTEAVSYYHKTYPSDDTYDEPYADYANENYSRAWKRVQIILSLLRGEEPEDVSFQ